MVSAFSSVSLWWSGREALACSFVTFSLKCRLSHPNGCHDLPSCLWAFGGVGMLALSYALGN